ncbi:MAG: hypothetical protein ABSH04_07860, partial [Acidimicrobiales bacterium]
MAQSSADGQEQSDSLDASSEVKVRYEDRVLAYLDILGWSDLVDEAGSDESGFSEILRAAGALRFTKDR